MTQTKIVIIGGGFAGLSAALGLAKQNFRGDWEIILVDKEPYHLFTGNLYEVATAGEELVTIKQLKQSITLPFGEIIKNKQFELVKGEVISVDTAQKSIVLRNKKIIYDYLLMATGSEPEYFNIPGAKEYGMPLKSLPNALKIKNALEFAIENCKFDIQKKYVRILIVGGGYTGVEVAAEITLLTNFLAWKHNYPREKIQIEILEASNNLMPGMGKKAINDARARLNDIGVRLRLLSPVSQITAYMVEVLGGERIPYDCLIWSVGVRAKKLPQGLNVKINNQGRVEVNEYLKIKGYENIFALGDLALVLKPDKTPVPQSAQDAIHQGRYLARALPILMQNQKPKAYLTKAHGFIVTVGGKWAILNYPPFYFTGWFAYFVHELAHLKYFASLIGWWKALKLVWLQDKLYKRND